MGRPYSQDLRDRVISAVDEGTAVLVVAGTFRVSVSYIYKAMIRRRMTGETTARAAGRGPEPKLSAHLDALREQVRSKPDATLEELREWLSSDRGIRVSIGCLWASLRSLDITLKKSRSTRPSRKGQTLWPLGPSGSPARAN